MVDKNKHSLTVTLPIDIMEFLRDGVESREFASLSHGVELCVLRYKEEKEKVVKS